MNAFKGIRGQIVLQALIFAVTLMVASWYADSKKDDVISTIRTTISGQHEILLTLAETTDRNGVDETVERIIVDCSERNRFEELLGQLGSLGSRDLLTVQQLFESCGDFYATQKGFMISRISREFTVLKDTVVLYGTLVEDEKLATLVADWNAYVDKELLRSEYMNEQVVLQREIIKLLLTGSRINSSDVAEKVRRAQEVGESLMVLDSTIDEARAELSKLAL